MREWVDLSVANILELRPRRVLEIGCGTGLLALQVAPHCGVRGDRRVADGARAARSGQGRGQGIAPDPDRVPEAADPGDTAPASFDVVVVNSVVRYLGGEDELSRVLDNAIRATAPGGAVYVGDVRNLAVLDAFYASLAATAQPRVTRPAARSDRAPPEDRARARHPPAVLPRPAAAPPRPHGRDPPQARRRAERGPRYRCDVTLRVGAEPARDDVAAWRDWRAEAMTPERLAREFAALTDGRLAFANIPNARVIADAALVAFSLPAPRRRRARTLEQLLASAAASARRRDRSRGAPQGGGRGRRRARARRVRRGPRRLRSRRCSRATRALYGAPALPAEPAADATTNDPAGPRHRARAGRARAGRSRGRGCRAT